MIINAYLEDIIELLLTPIEEVSPYLIVSKLEETVLGNIYLALWLALLMSLPAIYKQIWQFIKPALYYFEKVVLKTLLGGSLLAMFMGFIYGCIELYPWVQSLYDYDCEYLVIEPEITAYLEEVMELMLIIFLVVQLAIILTCLLLLKIWFKPDGVDLSNRIAYIFGSMVFAVYFTPPLLLSQIAVLLGLLLFFELCLIGALFLHCYTK